MEKLQTLKVDIPQKNAYSYDILIGENLLSQAEGLIKKYTKANKFLVVTNETVAKLYRSSLKIKNAAWVVLKDGEEYKNYDMLKVIIDAAVAHRLERKDCIIAFGGGVIGDMAGFAAASYMRGVDFIQIPTTLLAQVDSSVGGKVGINHEHGKNMIGAFYQPKVVLADISVLKTLDLRQLKTGLAEVLKYALIERTCGCEKNFKFFNYLKKYKDEIYKLEPDILSELIQICCTLKACVVNQDEREKGLRAILNFGHTYGHVIETLTNYTVFTHGEAVAMGMKMALKLSYLKGLIEESYYKKSLDLIEQYKLIDKIPSFDKERFYDEMFLDKKSQNGKLRFVLPNGLYTVKITADVTKEQIFQSLDV